MITIQDELKALKEWHYKHDTDWTLDNQQRILYNLSLSPSADDKQFLEESLEEVHTALRRQGKERLIQYADQREQVKF